MRSNSERARTIETVKAMYLGRMPAFVDLGQRHLEKENKPPTVTVNGVKEFLVPVDLFGLPFGLPSLLADIEEIRFGYKK